MAAPSDTASILSQLSHLRETSPNILFFIARSKNQNIVVYEANVKDGQFDPVHPVGVYWLDIDPDYQRKARSKGITSDRLELNTIERRMAYGLSSSPLPQQPNQYQVKLVAFPSRQVRVAMHEGRPHAYITIQGKEADLVRIYVSAHENFIGLPTVDYCDVTGIVTADKSSVTERIMP